MSTIQKYVNYLIEDLQKAKNNIPLKPDYSAMQSADSPPQMVEWETTPFQTMESIFEIDQIEFPPAARLTLRQMRSLNKAIIDMWVAFNFIPDLPADLPETKKYELLIRQWKNEVQHLTEGEFHIEFCDYHPEACPLGFEYCKCKGFIEEDQELFLRRNKGLKD